MIDILLQLLIVMSIKSITGILMYEECFAFKTNYRNYFFEFENGKKNWLNHHVVKILTAR